MNNLDLLNRLSEKVHGHEHAKKVLINLVNRSKTRAYLKKNHRKEVVDICNCLLIGSSGTGKSYLLQTLSEVMRFPYIYIDATELTHTSAEGLTKAKLVGRIKSEAKTFHMFNSDLVSSQEEALTQMIVFVDEVDKLANKSGNNWNQGTQSSFLTLFENGSDLQDVTWVFAGAFSNMHRTSKETTIGFTNNTNTLNDDVDLANEMVKYGLMPELVGRMGVSVELDTLKTDDYEAILKEKILPEKTKQLKLMGTKKFNLNKQAIQQLAINAQKSGLGVRYLNKEIDALTIDFEFSNFDVHLLLTARDDVAEHNRRNREFIYVLCRYISANGYILQHETVRQLQRQHVINFPLHQDYCIAVFRKGRTIDNAEWMFVDTTEANLEIVEALASDTDEEFTA